VDRLDDLAGVDSLQVDGGNAEVGVAQLALDHIQRHALARHLHRVGVAELVRREATAHPGPDGEAPKLSPHGWRGPRLAGGRPLEHAEERPHRQLDPVLEPGSKLLPAPLVHADLAAAAALAAADQHRPAAGLEVAFGKGQCL